MLHGNIFLTHEMSGDSTLSDKIIPLGVKVEKKPNPKKQCSLIVFMSLLYFVGGPKTSNLIVVPMVQVPC